VLPLFERWARIMLQTNRSVQKNRLLAALPQEDLDQFFLDLDPVSLSLRQILCQVGAPFEHVYFIERGVASVLTTMANGTNVEVGMIGKEGVAGLPAVLGGTISDQLIIVQATGPALRMGAAKCAEAFDQSATVRRVFLRFTEAFLGLAGQTAACNRLHSTQQRFARWLLMAHARLEADIIPMTHEFMSLLLGVRRTGITEAAGKLQRSGSIRYHQGQVTILDHEALEATACECYGADQRRLLRLH
jgi:CRP-like cAMP-binding protein